jgi:protein SCO1/2
VRTRPAPLRRTLAVSLLALGLAACDTAPRDFTLTDHHGQRFELASLRGTAVLVFFGYSSCPDVCPTTLSKLSAVTRRLGDAATGVKTLYVTVDPERDTPEVLQTDLSLFRLDALGLTGTREEIDAVAKQFGAAYEIVPTPQSAGEYSVSHTTDLYLLDRTGRLHRTFAYEANVEEIVEGIREVLAEGG